MSRQKIPEAEALPSYDNNDGLGTPVSDRPDYNNENHINISETMEMDGNRDCGSTPSSVDENEKDPETLQKSHDLQRSESSEVSSESSSEDEISVREEDDQTSTASETAENNNHNNSASGCEYSSLVVSIESLPPLPQPRHNILRTETKGGLVVVITASLVSVVLTHYIALTLILPPGVDGNNNDGIDDEKSAGIGRAIFLVLVYTESSLAMACILGVLCIDPCVVHRSEETCTPLPLAVESWVLSGGATPRPQGLEQYIRGKDQRLYCTKCLVWRTAGKGTTHYHCSICQRCCSHHDHHCNVLGRCIAGNPLFWKKGSHGRAGNLLCFYGLLATAALGFFTVFSAFVYALSMRYGTIIGVPIGLLAMLLVSCCCFGNSPINILCLPVCRLARCTKRFLRGQYRQRR